MKPAIAIIFTLLSSSLSFAAANFDKKPEPIKNIMNESKISSLSTEASLQPYYTRSLDSMRVMIGTPTNAKGVGPAAQVEWSTRLSHQNPIFASAGLGYFAETKSNSEGNSRNFHQVPVYINMGYSTRLLKKWKAVAAAGPVLRQTFERGNTREQNRTYAYGDLIASLDIDYEWLNTITGSGSSVGLRATRMFGLANSTTAAPIDAVLAGFAFDL